MDFQKLIIRDKPRNGANADGPGSYEVVTVADRTVVDPGDKLTVDVYITGYGNILNSKIAYYPPAVAFDENDSLMHSSFKVEDDDVTWGGQSHKISAFGLVINTDAGMGNTKWGKTITLFFDVAKSQEDKSLQLSTEVNFSNPPFKIALKISDKAIAGNYSHSLVFTYFNGSEWKTSSTQINFSVRNIFQRNEWQVSLLAYAAAVFTIVGALASVISIVNTVKVWLQ